jgi:hypothetical protein
VRCDEGIDEVENVRPVGAEHAAGASAVAVDAIRRHSTDDHRIAHKVGATGIAEACAAGLCIVREQQREIADKSGVLPFKNIRQLRMRYLNVVPMRSTVSGARPPLVWYTRARVNP